MHSAHESCGFTVAWTLVLNQGKQTRKINVSSQTLAILHLLGNSARLNRRQYTGLIFFISGLCTSTMHHCMFIDTVHCHPH